MSFLDGLQVNYEVTHRIIIRWHGYADIIDVETALAAIERWRGDNRRP
ncbi:hypothetical protein [Roseomonas gilardii]|nr:hypothetical protein [Roseomonas gilardii]